MGISTAGHLPSVTSTTYPSLTSHLLATYNATKIANWTITIRVLRSTRIRNNDEDQSIATTSKVQLNKLMYLVNFSEFPEETFVLIEDPQEETRASVRNRHAFAVMQAAANTAPPPLSSAQSNTLQSVENQDTTMNVNDSSLPPSVAGTNTQFADVNSISVAGKATRHTLFTTSKYYASLLARSNLPAPLGAPSSGDGSTTGSVNLGPGAWIPRGAPVIIQGAVYALPSTISSNGIDSTNNSENQVSGEWKIRLGMIQVGGAGTKGAGAIVENEYLPLMRFSSDAFLNAHLASIFPPYLLTTTTSSLPETTATTTAAAAQPSILINGPTSDQWQEVIPASQEAWMMNTGIGKVDPVQHELNAHKLPLQVKDTIGWQGKERGRRLAYLYITLLRNQSVL